MPSQPDHAPFTYYQKVAEHSFSSSEHLIFGIT
jgi:hypothetical protein